MYVCMYVCVCRYGCMYVYMYVFVYNWICVLSMCVCIYSRLARTLMHVCTYACVKVWTHARTHAYTHLCLHSLMYILPYVFMYVCMNVGRYLFILHSFIYLWMHVSVHIGMNVRIHICTYVLVNACMLHSSMYAVVLSDFLLTKILFWQHYAGVRMCFSKFLGSLTCTSVKKGAWCLCANTIFTLYYVRTVKFVGFSLWTLGIFIALIYRPHSTQHLTERSIRDISWKVKAAGA